VAVNGLVMGRNHANRLWTTYEFGQERNQLMHTDFGLEWRGGVEIRFGRRFCCDRWALEATYWTLGQFEGSTHYRMWTDAGGDHLLSTPLSVGNIRFLGVPGQPSLAEYFDQAQEHRLYRRDEFHNLELNLIRNRILCASDMPWDLDCSIGIRYFRFRESLVFESDSYQPTPGLTGVIDEEITNNLIGAQLGFDAGWYVAERLRLFAAPKFGIYNNHITNYLQIYRADLGTGVTPTALDEHGNPIGTYPAGGSRNVVSFLTQIDLGLEWQFAQNWSAQVGYRVVAVTGVGLADHQLPTYMVDIPEIQSVRSNGDLVLHGAFAGLTWKF